jgi:predicted deacylase
MKIINALQRNARIFRAAYQGLWQVKLLVWFAVILAASLVFFSVITEPGKAEFSFAKQQCVQTVVLLPRFQKNSNNTEAEITYENPIIIAGLPIIARKACFTFSSAPIQNKRLILSQNLFGVGIFTKKVIFSVGAYPKLTTTTLPATISTNKPLAFVLTRPDSFFSYSLKTGTHETACNADGKKVACDIKSLKLEHSKSYEFLLEQSFNDARVSVVANMQTVTANPVVLTADSLANNATVFDKPSELTIAADRDLQLVDGVTLTSKPGTGEPKQIVITTKTTGNKITITWTDPLPRLADYELTITNASSADGGALIEPFKTNFKTSGGPKVVGASIRDRAVPIGQRIVLTLDQTMQTGQNLNALFGIKVGNTVVPSLVTLSGRTVSILPSTPLDGCVAFQVWAADGALNTAGVSGGSAWAFNSRVTCATSFSIGASVQGRAIIGYRFGSGPNVILFNGNLHGNEINSQRLLSAWMDEIEGTPGRIPAGKSIVVIPSSNPDGAAANTRTNAHNVDLNRNFPANNWKSSVKMPSGETLDTGGGVSALSEPESSALATYIGSLAPRFVVSYHSKGNVVVANDAGNAWNLTQTYSSKSGYGAQNGSTIGNFFDYDTTGALEDWLADKKGIPAILVELSTRENDEFNRNKNAMWQVIADY